MNHRSWSSAGPGSANVTKVGTTVSSLSYPSAIPLSKPISSSITGGKSSSVTLTKKEMEERRKKGLCYWCNDKYTASHRCKESQVMMLVIPGHDEDEFVDAIDALDKDDVEPEVIGTINALEGREDFSTLRILGTIKKRQVVILVDTGSSHNVVHSNLVKRLSIPCISHAGVRVRVAGGSLVKVDRFCKELSWTMANSDFSDDFMVMDVGAFDMILGVQWLKKLGRIILDLDQSFMAFNFEGRYHELFGLGFPLNGPQEEEQISSKDLNGAAHVFLVYDVSVNEHHPFPSSL